MLNRHSLTAACVLIFAVLVAASVPHVSSVGLVVVSEDVSQAPREENILAAGGRSPAFGPGVNTQAYSQTGSSLAEEIPPPSPTRPAPAPTATPAAPTPTRTPTAVAPTPTLSAVQTASGKAQTAPSPGSPSPNHIGLQAGHWKYSEAPPPLNTMTGTSGGGKTEPEVTLAIANEVARILRALGHRVDILPTVLPRGYKADLFLAIHADGSTNIGARGFFTDRPEGSPVGAAEARLSAAIDYEYARATGIPYVNRSTPASHYYYGYREVASTVPRVLIETGFLTNATDREILVSQPKRSAQGIADGIGRYLSQ